MSSEKKGTRLAFVGFSASGKTSLGKVLREKYKFSVVDLDQYLEQRAGKSIAEIIRVEGEDAFRKLEEETLRNVLDSEFKVLVLGGGALLRKANRDLLSQKIEKAELTLVTLAVSEEVAASRVFSDEDVERANGRGPLRPLLSKGDKSNSLQSCREGVQKLMKERTGLYDSSQIELWTDWTNLEALAEKVLQLTSFSFDSRIVSMPASADSVDLGEVRIGSGLLSGLSKSVEQLFPKAEKLALIVDENVWQRWGKEIESSLASASYAVFVHRLPAGEKTKSFSFLEETLEKLLEFGLSRSDVVIGIGGGVVGDLAGLVASLYMRGVGLIQLPTTIVAQADSAIGGKTAVNLPGGKNLVGTFYPASLVLSDLNLLSSLPEREFRAGLAEVIKYGLIYSSEFFDWFEENVEDICKRNKSALEKIVVESSRIKLDFVCKDLRDLSGRRAMLNYGHTLGHVIEKLAGYGELLHGEAIAIGMIFALSLGSALGKTGELELERVRSLFGRCGLPVELPKSLAAGASQYHSERSFLAASLAAGKAREWRKLEVEKLSSEARDFYERFRRVFYADKKRVSKNVSFILLERIGQARVEDVGLDRLIDHLAEMAEGNF